MSDRASGPSGSSDKGGGVTEIDNVGKDFVDDVADSACTFGLGVSPSLSLLLLLL